MSTDQQFTGLPMPVFTAFGWAGEEAALQFALTQLELFIAALHARLPRATQARFPFFGLSKADQNAYLSSSENAEEGVHIFFNARPMSLELQLAIMDKALLAKGLELAENQPVGFHRTITELGPEWTLRVQQMQVDPESGDTGHYQDLFKDTLDNLDDTTSQEVFSKAAYLNGEEKWLTPVYLGRRFSSEQASAMGTTILSVMAEQIDLLMPIITFFMGETKRKSKSSRATRTAVSGKSVASTAVQTQTIEPSLIEKEEGFTYISDLQPLHLRRGFINMTPAHWPFFSINSRTEIRNVTIYYNGVYDKDSTVWRMKPNDLARLVLSPPVHQWLEDNFEPDEQIQLTAVKLDEDEIQISLKPID